MDTVAEQEGEMLVSQEVVETVEQLVDVVSEHHSPPLSPRTDGNSSAALTPIQPAAPTITKESAAPAMGSTSMETTTVVTPNVDATKMMATASDSKLSSFAVMINAEAPSTPRAQTAVAAQPTSSIQRRIAAARQLKAAVPSTPLDQPAVAARPTSSVQQRIASARELVLKTKERQRDAAEFTRKLAEQNTPGANIVAAALAAVASEDADVAAARQIAFDASIESEGSRDVGKEMFDKAMAEDAALTLIKSSPKPLPTKPASLLDGAGDGLAVSTKEAPRQLPSQSSPPRPPPTPPAAIVKGFRLSVLVSQHSQQEMQKAVDLVEAEEPALECEQAAVEVEGKEAGVALG